MEANIKKKSQLLCVQDETGYRMWQLSFLYALVLRAKHEITSFWHKNKTTKKKPLLLKESCSCSERTKSGAAGELLRVIMSMSEPERLGGRGKRGELAGMNSHTGLLALAQAHCNGWSLCAEQQEVLTWNNVRKLLNIFHLAVKTASLLFNPEWTVFPQTIVWAHWLAAPWIHRARSAQVRDVDPGERFAVRPASCFCKSCRAGWLNFSI